MCMVLYVASDRPLPLVAWDKENPAFNARELEENVKGVRKQFSKPYVYYLGSHQSCGCGFSYGYDDYGEEEDRAARESVRRLSEYLSQAVAIAGQIELYSCWSGDEEEKPEFQEIIKLEEIVEEANEETFCFGERKFIRLTN